MNSAMRVGQMAAAAMMAAWLAVWLGLAAGSTLTQATDAASMPVATATPTAAPMAAPEPVPAGWTLKGVVILSRHGMRGPTYAIRCDQSGNDPKRCLDAVGERPWPTFGVVAGHLLPEGYDRLRAMGRYYLRRYSRDGILPADGCPVPASVHFIADTDERVVMTAGAVMDGMFPGCYLDNIVVRRNLYRARSCGYSGNKAAESAQRFAGGSWEAAAKGELAGPIAALDKLIGPLKPDVCARLGLTAPCSSADLQTTDAKPGVINFLSQPAEQLIMQYGSGLPLSEVGWGRVAEATGMPVAEGIAYINKIHAFNDWVENASPYDAAHKGSPVLDLVGRNLRDVVAGEGAAFRFLSSHDNYILHVGGLLGLTWKLPGYPAHQVPLGGAIAFEVWQPAAGGPMVRLVYAAQTIQQLRDNPELTRESPPGLQVLPLRDCKPGPAGSCAWADFIAITERAILKACLRDP